MLKESLESKPERESAQVRKMLIRLCGEFTSVRLCKGSDSLAVCKMFFHLIPDTRAGITCIVL